MSERIPRYIVGEWRLTPLETTGALPLLSPALYLPELLEEVRAERPLLEDWVGFGVPLHFWVKPEPQEAPRPEDRPGGGFQGLEARRAERLARAFGSSDSASPQSSCEPAG